MVTLSHAAVTARHRPAAVDLAATLATTATHLLQARRQRTEANDKDSSTVAASAYTSTKQQPAYRGGRKRGVASDGSQPNRLLHRLNTT
jgi:hypothetical protein